MANTKDTNPPAPSPERHPALEIASEVDMTHPGLGNLAAVSAIAAKARKCTMVIGFSGTGKSAIAHWLARQLPDAGLQGDLTMVKLGAYNAEFSDSEKSIIVEDLGEGNNEWTRIQTLIGLSALTYTHYITKDTAKCTVRIENFYGSAWIGIQPRRFKEAAGSDAWQSNLRDKTLRWYHLTRPTAPNFDEISVPIEWGIPITDVKPLADIAASFPELISIGRTQWSFARAQEHVGHLLAACAALRGSDAIAWDDGAVLLDLMRPMLVEREVLSQDSFDSNPKVDNDLFAILTEFASYETINYDIIAQDYGMRPRKVLTIMETMWEWYHKVGDHPPTFAPSTQLKLLLQEIGLR